MFEIDQIVLCRGKQVKIINVRRVQGLTQYYCRIEDGYYTDQEDGTQKYNSSLIVDAWLEEKEIAAI